MAGKRGGDEAVNRRVILAALGECRAALVREMPTMKPMGPLYSITSGVLAAIDALATFITRDPTFFHDKGTTRPPARWDGEEG